MKNANKTWQNWNGNIKHTYEKIYYPKSEPELRRIIANSAKVRVVGAGHSTSDIAGGTDTLISLKKYNRIKNIDHKNKRITIESGAMLSDLLDELSKLKWTIPCLPDISSISIGGAIATATHGTSDEGYILSQYVVALRLITADGQIQIIDELNDNMAAVRVSLGVLGIISEVTFQCTEEYILHIKERPIRDKVWVDKFDMLARNHDFFRVLWLPHTGFGYVITGDKVTDYQSIKQKKGPRHLKYRRYLSTKLYEICFNYPRFSVYINKLIFLLFYTFKKEHSGNLYETTVTKVRGKGTSEITEWTVARDNFHDLFVELKKEFESHNNIAYAHIPMDIRIVKRDNSWLSYAYQRDIVTVGLTCRVPSKADEYEAFRSIERIFLKYQGRPHWAKKFLADGKILSGLYPKWSDFLELRESLDPKKKFLNKYLLKVFTQ
ncbi:MAG: L-gulono-1,4-lactone dehydrogenase [Candidatus Dojkabacteria bacterium]|nr:MAG: L-gulono-1,4-lactone dehydrogenase [Candidatus Dojkabacteria bacterium]